MVVLSMQFLGLAVVVAAAGIFLARSADAIAEITRWGRALVGSILLAAATSLPELTVDIAAVRSGLSDLAAGDLLGSSLMNLLILAGIDLSQRGGRRMLSHEAASHALSATLAIALTSLVGMAVLTAAKLPSVSFLGIGGWSWSILVAYLLGARMLFIDQRISVRSAVEKIAEGHGGAVAIVPLWKPVAVFVMAASAVCVAGPRLAHVAGELAEQSGLGGTFVGTTLVAITTSLPELVASVTAVRMGAVDLAIGNTFGSNAFNMILFVPLDAVHDGPLFTSLLPVHAVTAFAVIVATSIAVLGQLYHEDRRIPLCEPDAVLIVLVISGALLLVFYLA